MQRTAMNEDLSPTKTKQNERMNDLRSRSRMGQKPTKARENRTYICREGSRPHERYTIYVQLLLLGTNVIGQEGRLFKCVLVFVSDYGLGPK